MLPDGIEVTPSRPVYLGSNTILLNGVTVNRIVEEWLNLTHLGGPYKVDAVCQKNKAYDGDQFEIKFTCVEPPATPTNAG